MPDRTVRDYCLKRPPGLSGPVSSGGGLTGRAGDPSVMRTYCARTIYGSAVVSMILAGSGRALAARMA